MEKDDWNRADDENERADDREKSGEEAEHDSIPLREKASRVETALHRFRF
jgi:hypothetical protein